MTPRLEEAELDALAEACNIGMGHAATALSQLMGKGVNIQAPRLQVLDRAAMAGLRGSDEVRGLHLLILGNIRGSILILLSEENARRILELLLGGCNDSALPLSELEVSTLKEVGNIVASACLNAFGQMMGMTLLPSVPALTSGKSGEMLAQVMEQRAEGKGIVMIDTVFSVGEALCGGSVFIIPAPESLGAIMSALAVTP